MSWTGRDLPISNTVWLLSAFQKKILKMLWLCKDLDSLKALLEGWMCSHHIGKRTLHLQGEALSCCCQGPWHALCKARESSRRGCQWVSSIHMHEESARVCACAGTQVLIAPSWCLDSNFEKRVLLSQLRSKVIIPLGPGRLAFGGKAGCKTREKNYWGHRKEKSGSCHFIKHPFFRKCHRFLISKQEKQITD